VNVQQRPRQLGLDVALSLGRGDAGTKSRSVDQDVLLNALGVRVVGWIGVLFDDGTEVIQAAVVRGEPVLAGMRQRHGQPPSRRQAISPPS